MTLSQLDPKGDDVFCKRKDSPADEDCPVAWQVEDLRLKKSLPTIAVLSGRHVGRGI